MGFIEALGLQPSMNLFSQLSSTAAYSRPADRPTPICEIFVLSYFES